MWEAGNEMMPVSLGRKLASPCTTASRSRYRWLGAIAIVLVSGCGDSTDTPAGAGGAGAAGTGGKDGGVEDSGSQRDGPRRPPAQGSVSLHLTELDTSGAQCAPGRQWVNAPSTPTAIPMQRTTDHDIGPRAVDGVEGDHVTCTVRKTGDTFMFSADITTRRTDGTNVLHPTVLHFEASALQPSGPPAQGVVTAMNERTGGNFEADACSFSVASPSASLDINAGRIWASVICDLLADPTSPGEGCRLDVGFLVFENCAE
jgi:hypothetical protein